MQASTLENDGAERPVVYHPVVYQWKGSPYSSHSALLRLLPAAAQGQDVLDAGCGNGYLGAALAARGFRVTGIDRDAGHGSDFPSSVSLIRHDLEQGLPPIYEKFDIVVCADILEHLRRPGDLLREIRGVMKPGARLFASLPNSGNIYFRYQVVSGRFPQHDQGLFDRTHLRFYTWDGWAKLFHENGFRIQSVEVTSVPFERAFAGSRRALLAAAERFNYRLARAWKALFAYQFVVTAIPDDDARVD